MEKNVFKINGDLFLDENTHIMYYKNQPLFSPSVSTIIGMVYPFDLSDFVQDLMKKNNISFQQATKMKDMILSKAQKKGTCIHFQIQMYIQKKQKVGCQCDVMGFSNKKISEHQKQFDFFKDWIVLLDMEESDLEWSSEILYVNDALTLTGAQDVLAVKEDKIFWGDWKTTLEPHPKKEIMQILLYRFLATNNFDIKDKESFFVFNTNKHGVHWFKADEIKKGLSDAILGLKRWNNLSIKEKIMIMRPNWNNDKILLKLGDLILDDKDLIIPYDKKYEKLIIK